MAATSQGVRSRWTGARHGPRFVDRFLRLAPCMELSSVLFAAQSSYHKAVGVFKDQCAAQLRACMPATSQGVRLQTTDFRWHHRVYGSIYMPCTCMGALAGSCLPTTSTMKNRRRRVHDRACSY